MKQLNKTLSSEFIKIAGRKALKIDGKVIVDGQEQYRYGYLFLYNGKIHTVILLGFEPLTAEQKAIFDKDVENYKFTYPTAKRDLTRKENKVVRLIVKGIGLLVLLGIVVLVNKKKAKKGTN